MPHAVFALRVERGVVVAAAPIAAWMIGKPWRKQRQWIKQRGGHGAPLEMKGME